MMKGAAGHGPHYNKGEVMPRVSRCRVFINGSEMSDFKNFRTNDREIARTVKLMNATDYVDVTPENVFMIDYVPKKGVAEYDFEGMLDGTKNVKVAKHGGGSYLFQNCKCLTIGGEDMDGEKELVKTITVFAESRSDE